MSSLQRTYQSHLLYFSDRVDLFIQLQKQLSKDLNADFLSENDVEQLYLSLKTWVGEQLKFSPATIQAALYRVDVNQMVLEREMQSGKWASDAELWTMSILIREMEKVILRNKLAGRI